MKKQTIKDCIKAATLMVLIMATMFFVFCTDNEFYICIGVGIGFVAYALGTQWREDEQDEKSGLNKAVNDELGS